MLLITTLLILPQVPRTIKSSEVERTQTESLVQPARRKCSRGPLPEKNVRSLKASVGKENPEERLS